MMAITRRLTGALAALLFAFAAHAQIGGPILGGGSSFITSGGTFTAQMKGGDGTCAAPTYSFSGQTGTGMFRPAGGGLSFCSSGTAFMTAGAASSLLTLQYGASANDIITISTSGALTFKSNAGGVKMQLLANDGGGLGLPMIAADTPFVWATVNNIASQAYDVALWRDAAAVLALKNTTTAQALRIYGTTTGPKYLSISHDGTNAVIDTASGSGVISIAPTNASSVTIGKKISSYQGITTAGNIGVPTVVASARSTAQTAAVASVATFTPAADATFEVSANVLVTTATTHAFTVTCTYTDEGNTARTLTLPFVLVAGTAIVNSVANANGAVPYMGIALTIRAKAATAITIATTGTFTTVTYNVEGNIRQIN